jgi:aspartyl/asparaginyl beta-hydroxylase (cupin superfamily)
MRALSRVPGLVTALFSILEPGMHVKRHRGVSKGILIAHLGLRVPVDIERCQMEVEDQRVHWQEGSTFVFDDTYPHEVWNDTTERRVILLVQFQRPMKLIGRVITRLLVGGVRRSPYIQDARRNIDYWERCLQASEARSQDGRRGAGGRCMSRASVRSESKTDLSAMSALGGKRTKAANVRNGWKADVVARVG